MKRIHHPKKQDLIVDSEGSWIISYGDMVTLLLAFFIIFFTLDPKKQYFNLLTNTLELKLKDITPKVGPVLTAGDSDSGMGATKNQERGMDVSKWGARVIKSGEHIIIDFPNVSFFDSAKIDLTQEGRKTLKNFVTRYLPYAGNYVIGIRAYTDTKKVMNRPDLPYKDNLELSALRSVSAMRVMQEFGIPLTRMKLGGYGELKTTEKEFREQLNKKTQDKSMAFSRTIVLVIEPDITGDNL